MSRSLLATMLACIALVLAGPGSAAEVARLDGGLIVERWSVDDGLPVNSPTDVVATPDGYLWISTLDGLVRFDGLDFQVSRRSDEPTLLDNRLVDLEVGPHGHLWVLTEDGALLRRRAGQFDLVWPPSAGLRIVRSFVVLDRALLVATDAGLFRVEGLAPDGPPPDAARSVELRPLIPGFVDLVAQGSNGMLWAVRAGDLFRWPPASFPTMVARVQGVACSLEEELDTGRAWLEFKGGTAWSESGVDLPAMGSPDHVGCPTPSLPAFGSRWGIRADGLLRDGELALPLPRAAQDLVEVDGVLWLLTKGAGLYRVRAPAAEVVSAGDGRSENIQSVAVDGDTVWLSTAVDGLLRVEAGVVERLVPERPDAWDEERARAVSGLYVPGPGELWVGTRGGMVRRIAEEWTSFAGGPGGVDGTTAFGMLLDREGRGWVGYEHGYWRGPAPETQTKWTEVGGASGFSGDRVSHVVQLADGTVVLATRQVGIVAVRGDEHDALGRAQGAASDRVRHVHEDADGLLWLGTEDAGLCRVRRIEGRPLAEAEVRCLARAEGLPSDGVHCVMEDEHGRFWMSSNQGLFAVRRADVIARLDGEDLPLLPLFLGRAQGLINPEANGGRGAGCAVAPDGRLWFATQHGAAVIDPAQTAGLTSPAPSIDRMTVDGRPVSIADATSGAGLVLGPESHGLAVDWSAPELIWPQQVQFRHRLVGLDEAWSPPSSKRHAEWPVLPPGSYRLEVQAGLAGRWTSLETPLRWTRQPTFVESGWFPLSLVLLTVLGVGLVAFARGRRMVRVRRALEDEVEDRTAALARSNQTLGTTNQALADRARDLELANHRISVQNERLAELDKLKAEFVASVSHELRTPLTLIRGGLDDLAGDAGGEPATGRLEVVQRNAARLAELVDQLLDVSTSAKQEWVLRARRQDLGAFVRSITERFDGEARRRRLQFDVSTPPLGPVLYFDPDLVEKIVSNLLTNALKFTPVGGSVHLRLPHPSSGASFVRVEVIDSGEGVAEDQASLIFERFYRVHRGDKAVTEGMGIGLALVRSLVELHGGEVGVDREAAGGSRFWFTLPIGVHHLALDDIDLVSQGRIRAVAGEHPAAPSDTPTEIGPSDGPLVLLAEDHPDMRRYLADHLAERYRVLITADGVEALEAARERVPDLIVTDVMMPRMSGLELCQAVRQDERLCDIPLVIVSAKASDEARLGALELVDDYIVKPFRMAELLARLDALLRRADATRRSQEFARPSVGVASEQDQQAPASDEMPDEVSASPAGPAGAACPGQARPEAETELLDRIEARVDEQMAASDFDVSALASALGMSPRQLRRRVRDLVGLSPSELLRERRLTHARDLLRRGTYETVSEVASAVGLSRAYLSRLYSARFGASASDDLYRSSDGSE